MAYERDSEEDLVWDSEQGEYVPAAGEGFTLTISPTPADAIVTLTATGYTQTDNSITVANGTTVSYSVVKSGYTTQYGAVVVTETSTIPITLTTARPIVEESSIGNTVYDIHSKANKNNNTASGADEYVYNWVGTLAEYTTQDIEHTHPDWVCLITDDTSVGEATSNFYTKAEIDAILASGYYTKTEVGEMLNRSRYFFKWPSTTLEVSGSTKHEFDITPVLGRPVCLNISGDMQTVNGATGGWIQIQIYVDSPSGTLLTKQLAVSEEASTNIPFSLSYLDSNVQPGVAKHYYFRIANGGSTQVQLSENGQEEAPQLIAFEI